MAAVIPIGTRPLRALCPGTPVAWTDANGDTRTGVIAHDDQTTDGVLGGFQMGPPGEPPQHFVLVHPDDTEYVPLESLRLP